MGSEFQLANNVLDFLYQASDCVGRFSSRDFSSRICDEIEKSSINSPIEQIFIIAIKVMCRSMDLAIMKQPFSKEDEPYRVIYLDAQRTIGKYRVDFLVQNSAEGPTIPPPIVLELDGHKFHDKDKKQRAYEKSRDRFFVKEGYRVIHFTGSEVCSDPYKVAHEVLTLLGALEKEYNPTSPFQEGQAAWLN